MINDNPKVLIYASNKDWGGSEHLWYDAMSFLFDTDTEVHILCESTLLDSQKRSDLAKRGFVVYISKIPTSIKFIFRIFRRIIGIRFEFDFRIRYIRRIQPDFVFVNQGLNFDAFDLLQWLAENNIKYGTLSHAVDHRKPFNPIIIKSLQMGFSNASFNGFVSKANIRQTSEMIGMEVPNAKLFRNPVSVPDDINHHPYPSTKQGFFLAFVGRIDFNVKGQDILLEVLRQSKWISRELTVRFYGNGPDTDSLERILLDFPNGKHVYAGYKNQLEIWSENHALVLTSHFEGLPIVIMEAGLYSRTCLVTNVSGNAELLSDCYDGFVAHENSLEAIDEALERAWSKRFDWEQMGILLRNKMLDIVPSHPGRILANTILEQVNR